MAHPFVYALIDPLEPRHVRYIGMTMTDRRRPYAHVKEAVRTSHPTYAHRWIRKLLAAGRKYTVLILEEFSDETPLDDVCDAECDFIQAAKDQGHRLTNGNAGGKGSANPSAETRALISAGCRGRKVSDLTRARQSAARKMRLPESIELRAQKSERAKRQRPISPESLAKRNAGLLGNQYAVGSKSMTGQEHTLPARIKMQDAWTPERRAAQAERNREMPKWSLKERLERAEAALVVAKRRLAKSEALKIETT